MSLAEARLITRIVDTSNLRPALDRGIGSNWFSDQNWQAAWEAILRYYDNPEYTGVPGREYVARRLPQLQWSPSGEDVAALADELAERKLYGDMAGTLMEVQRAAQTDVKEAFTLLRDGVAGLTLEHRRAGAADITKEMAEVRAEYLRAKELGGILGLPFPWERVTKLTHGMQGGQLIFYYGRPGMMKTWLLQETMRVPHHMGRTILIVTREMSKAQMRRRAVALYTKVDYGELQGGNLEPEEERVFLDNLEAFEEMPPYVVFNPRGFDESALAEIEALVEEVEPDLVGIDSIYRFCANPDHMTFGNFVRGCKGLAVKYDLPFICTNQRVKYHVQGGKDSIDDMAYGDAAAQEADVAFKVTLDEKNQQLHLMTPKVREEKGLELTIHAKPATDFSQKFFAEDEEIRFRPSGTAGGGIVA